MRCLRLSIIIIATIFVAASTLEAVDWKQFYSITYVSNKTGNTIVHKEYYDRDSMIRTKRGTIKVWTNGVWEGEDADDRPKAITALLEMNCSERVYRLASVTRYFRDNRLEEDSSYSDQWDEIHPQSNREKLYKVICKKNKK